jgi:uncharacterized protein YigE (DUF2233 family)
VDPSARAASATPATGFSLGRSATLASEPGGGQLSELRWTLDGAEGWAWAARFPRDARLTVRPADAVQDLDDFPASGPGSVMVNGGFYDEGPMGLVRHARADVAPFRRGGGSGVLYWSPSGVDVVHHADWPVAGAVEALQSIDRIVDAGASLVNRREGAPTASRVGVGVSADAVWVVAASSDAGTLSLGAKRRRLHASDDAGLSLWAFAELLVGLGVERAMNLDGGVSTAMIARMGGETYMIDGGAGTINAVVVK